MMDLYIHRFPDATHMPIPPVAEHMETFKLGDVTVGVEYRILTDELLASLERKASAELGSLNDVGVSLHVFVKAADGDLERLRFDAFAEAPHYHYIDWAGRKNDHIFIDPTTHGDPLAWMLDLIRNRLPRMLERTGIDGGVVDQRGLEALMPVVTEAAYRARFHADRDGIAKGAVADAMRLRA